MASFVPTEQYAFLSQEPEASGGFAGYHQLYQVVSDVGRDAGAFQARVSVHRYARLLVFARWLAGIVHHRSPVRVRRDSFDHICIQLLLDGTMAGGRPGEERALAPGELILFDMTQPQRTLHDGAHSITLSLPREPLERLRPVPAGLHGTILPVAAGGLLADFMASLVWRSGQLAPAAAEAASTVATHMLAAALGQDNTPLHAEALRGHAAQRRLAAAQAYVEQHGHNPALDAVMVAAALGMSRSTLDRAFQAEGGFGRFLLNHRLDRMRAALRRAGEDRSVSAIAYAHGFANESHCNRVFRAKFGVPPGEYRHHVRQRVSCNRTAVPSGLTHLFAELQ